jgi:hypothetical protein
MYLALSNPYMRIVIYQRDNANENFLRFELGRGAGTSIQYTRKTVTLFYAKISGHRVQFANLLY